MNNFNNTPMLALTEGELYDINGGIAGWVVTAIIVVAVTFTASVVIAAYNEYKAAEAEAAATK
ncbi:MAG: class IIb bacteriocin, lactobin A/cerein 7B family [Clostridiaceae bacterium]|jgi:lactobin A/cerein 7B family class IIb bacteriocin|nr:class IIb bacteriocin, lactobin A/cerein 7B family [Clostridiaceae bacterium]